MQRSKGREHLRRKSKYVIKMDLKQIGLESVNLVYVARGIVHSGFM